MNIVLLSGGSGKRLWPLSNDIRSKQFIKIFKNADNGYESMIQRVYSQIRKIDRDATVTVATSLSQVESIRNQIGADASISIEPCRRDTFAAIALSSAYLHDKLHVSEDDSVVVCPVDPYVNDDYFEALKKLGELARTSDANLVLMGIEPTYPSEKFGYIIPESKDDVAKVATFKEKPDTETAKSYISQGALWNGGVFAYKLRYVLEKAHQLIDFKDYDDLFAKYETVKKISFDYAVVENEKNISVMRFNGMWKDLGTWGALTEALPENVIGKGTVDESSSNVHLINELDVPVLCMGLKDTVVVSGADGILVCAKDSCDFIKPYVEKFDASPRFTEKEWGTCTVLDSGEKSVTFKLNVKAGKSFGTEWHGKESGADCISFVSGAGVLETDAGTEKAVAGKSFSFTSGTKAICRAETDLVLIQTFVGDN